ncbi:hypothetical protein ABPG72_022082 [Tetrahymena utriculariae]
MGNSQKKSVVTQVSEQQNETSVHLTTQSQSDQFQEEYLFTTNQLFEGNQQEFIIIWGDPNNNLDNDYVKKGLIERYSFLAERIYKYENGIDFRRKSKQLSKRNILFLMSGTFANEQISGKSNLEWVNNQIQQQKIHSKSIILFTSMSTIQKNQWTIQNLQQKFRYVTQLSIEYSSLFTSIDKMIFNRIHRSFVQCNHLDYYFRAGTQSILNIFEETDQYSFKNLQISAQNLLSKFENLCEYLKTFEVQAPLTLYLSQTDKQATIKSIESCLYQNGVLLSDNIIIQNFINLYTQETPVYKILNFSLNTMNPKIYSYLSNLYKLLSKCLYLYDDKQNLSQIQLYRGAAIQKYQYDTLYEEYQYNLQQNKPTFIVFPQFLSTSEQKKVALQLTNTRIKEVNIENNERAQNLDQFSQLNKEYLKSDDFRKAYKVLIYIDAQFDNQNKYRPKSIQNISDFYQEKEYLFQPFQHFKVDFMQQGINEGEQLQMNIQYII